MAGTEHMHFCGAKTRDGGRCKQPCRRGGTRCRMHGGSIPQVVAKNERRVTEAALVTAANTYGQPRQVTAVDALEEELHRTQGHVDWLAARIAIERDPDPGWLAVYQSERAHLARLSHQMITANVAERQVVMAEQHLDHIEAAITETVRELLGGRNVNPDQVRAVLGRHLQAVSDDASGTVTAEVIPDKPDDGDVPQPVAF